MILAKGGSSVEDGRPCAWAESIGERPCLLDWTELYQSARRVGSTVRKVPVGCDERKV